MGVHSIFFQKMAFFLRIHVMREQKTSILAACKGRGAIIF